MAADRCKGRNDRVRLTLRRSQSVATRRRSPASQPTTEEIAMEFRLDGHSALITGGSKGLGLAMAVKFAAAGADVAILARNAGALEEAKATIKPTGKGKVVAL